LPILADLVHTAFAAILGFSHYKAHWIT